MGSICGKFYEKENSDYVIKKESKKDRKKEVSKKTRLID